MALPADSLEECFAAANVLLAAGSWCAAVECLEQVCGAWPACAEAWGNLGYARGRLARRDEAEAAYRQALALASGLDRVRLNLAALLVDDKRLDAAAAEFRAVLATDPGSAEAWSGLGVALACQGKGEAAASAYRTAMALDPDYRLARFNLAYLLLQRGAFEEGWACLEARDWYAAFQQRLACPCWQGEALTGKSIVLVTEAGQGDMIQFCRYVPMLKERGACRVDILCQPALVPLLASLSGVDRVLAVDAGFPSEYDFWIAPLSLPHRFGTRADSMPAALPYLQAAPVRVADWAARLPPRASAGECRIGLVWRGNPRFENDAERSLPSADLLAPLAGVPGVRFFSLQKTGPVVPEALPEALAAEDLAPALHDFAETAAALMGLDLLITVDTACAHLAGALGRPCWLLLPAYKTDWRWLLERIDSPWYPKVMRMFRQQPGEDWQPVIERVRDALSAWQMSSNDRGVR